MITQSYLDNEIEIATKIFLYYTEKILDYQSVNSFKYKKWYIDSLEVGFLLGFLESIILDDADNYIGYYAFSDDILITAFYKVREYWLDDIDSEYLITDLGNTLIPTGPTYQPYIIDWKIADIEITSDNTTYFTVPFDMDLVDPESLVVTVDDSSPIPTTSGEGYHIEDNIFYWTYYFELNTDNIVHIKYLQIKGDL